eukprot:scaffold348_cov151-Skeletonema_dohrnii-CCMP3373.AAC.6
MIDQPIARAHKSLSSQSATTKAAVDGKVEMRRRTCSRKGLGLRTPRASREAIPNWTSSGHLRGCSNADDKRAQVVTNVIIYHRSRIYGTPEAVDCDIHSVAYYVYKEVE